jgi:acyl-coenzyme A thioesterase PaaI-like protein
MTDTSVLDHMLQVLEARYGQGLKDFLLPPPSFGWMQGELVDFDPQAGTLITRFPVRPEYLNPHRIVQGGILAAAVDNTLGPLSMLMAPPNVTRRLEMKYSRPLSVESEWMQVTGKLLDSQGRQLRLSAEVRDSAGRLIARASALHWIVDAQPEEGGR